MLSRWFRASRAPALVATAAPAAAAGGVGGMPPARRSLVHNAGLQNAPLRPRGSKLTPSQHAEAQDAFEFAWRRVRREAHLTLAVSSEQIRPWPP